MKRKLFLSLMFIITIIIAGLSQDSYLVVSYNIWFDNPSNTENPWSERKVGVIETLQKLNPDIFCVQEALINQVNDLETGSYKHAGVGRDDGKYAGEFSAIFYDTNRFERLDASTFWLSDIPHKPGSKGWDAVCVRIATWIHLKDLHIGYSFFVFNTHFDHVGSKARLESAKLIKQKINEIAGEDPVILTGDFNCKKGSKPYEVIVSKSSGNILNDSRFASEVTPTDPEYSFVGSDFNGEPGDIIDHIFVSSGLKVKQAFIDLNCNDKCPSDHLPVVVEINY